MERVVITGIGAVCGNAADMEQLKKACRDGISGIRTCSVFDAGMLLTDQFGEAEGITGDNRLYELIRIACEQMMKDAGVTRTQIKSCGTKCRMFYGTLLSTSDTYLRHSTSLLDGKEDHSLALMNEFADYAAMLTGVEGLIDVSSAACASGTTAVGMAFDYIRSGKCECAIAGGADSLNRLSAFGFHALKSLSGSVCNPYDEAHDGITIGECGAFFLLESLSHALARGAKIHCEVSGYALGNDAYHITSPEPGGHEACYTMNAALQDAGISCDDLDYINGHGTGTKLNDAMEIGAMHLLYGERPIPHVSSTKALVGHCMGASGAIELASVIGMMESKDPIRMPNLQHPLGGETMFLAPEHLDIHYAMSNSFGFAGNSASLIVKTYRSMEEPSDEAGAATENNNAVMDRDVYINGLGIISRCACSKEELQELVSGGMGKKAVLPLEFPIEIPSSKLRRNSRYNKLACAAADQALKDAHIPDMMEKDGLDGHQVGTILSTGYGAAEYSSVFADTVVKNDPGGCSPAVFSGSVPNSCVGQICILNQLKGFSTVLAGGDPLEYAFRLLSSGKAEHILAGSVEEFFPPLYEAFDVLDAAKGADLSEGAAMAVLSCNRTEETYCKVTSFASCHLGHSPLIHCPDESGESDESDTVQRIKNTLRQFSAPDAVFVSGNGTWFDAVENAAVGDVYSDAEIQYPKHDFGETLGCGYMMNVLLAAASIRSGKYRRVLATGIDMIGNYTCVMLEP